MASNNLVYRLLCFLFISFSFTLEGFAQDTSTFKAQVALGINNPSRDGFVQGFEGQTYNFPTVNLGVQYMFKQRLGAKLDYGFNRISNQDFANEFKLNYARINAQLVYDTSKILSFLPSRIGTFVHAGPGFSMIKPLGNYTDNDLSYLNLMAGMELHFGVSDKLSIYLDVSYIHGFADDFQPVSDGFGAFKGNLLTFTIGASISLSGCYYCEENY